MGEDELKIRLQIETFVKDAGIDVEIDKIDQFEKSLKQTFGSSSVLAENTTRASDRIKELNRAFQKAQEIMVKIIPLDEKYTDALGLLNKEKKLLSEFSKKEQKDLDEMKTLSESFIELMEKYPTLYEDSALGASQFVNRNQQINDSLEKAFDQQIKYENNLIKIAKTLDVVSAATVYLRDAVRDTFSVIISSSDNASAAVAIFQKGLTPLGKAWDNVKEKMKQYFVEKISYFNRVISGIKTKIINLVKDLGGKLLSIFKMPKASFFTTISGFFARMSTSALLFGASLVTLGLVILPVIAALTALFVVLIPLVTALAMITVGFKLQIKTMEAFRTANYRALGSIKHLSKASFELMRDLGSTNEEAINSIKALSEAGFTAAGLAKKLKITSKQTLDYGQALGVLARQNAMFAKATGVSAKITAEFQKRMTALGFSVPKVQGMLDLAAGAMKEYGITADEVGRILGKIRQKSLGLQLLWGDKNINKQFTELQFAASGLAQQLGVPLGQMQNFIDLVANADSGMTQMVMTAGMTPSKNMKEFALQAAKAAKYWTDISARGGDMPMVVREMMQTFGLNLDQLGAGVKLYEKFGKVGSAAFDETISKLKETGKIQRAFAESMQTLPQKLNQLFGPILYMASELAGPLIRGIISGFEEILGITLELSDSKSFDKFRESVEAMAPVVKELGVAFVKFGVLFMKTVFTMVKAIFSIIPKLYKAIGGLSTLIAPFIVSILKAAAILEWVDNKMPGGKSKKKTSKTAGQAVKMDKLFKDLELQAGELEKKLHGIIDIKGKKDKALAFAALGGPGLAAALRADAEAKALAKILSNSKGKEPASSKVAKAFLSGKHSSGAIEVRAARAIEMREDRRAVAVPNYTVQFTEITAKTNEHLENLIMCCSSLGDLVSIIKNNQLSKEEISDIISMFKEIARNSAKETLDPWRRPGGIGGRGEANTEWIRRFG